MRYMLVPVAVAVLWAGAAAAQSNNLLRNTSADLGSQYWQAAGDATIGDCAGNPCLCSAMAALLVRTLRFRAMLPGNSPCSSGLGRVNTFKITA